MTIRQVGFVLLVWTALLVGCGRKETYETPERTATVTTDPSGESTTTKVETAEGTATMEATTDGDSMTATVEQGGQKTEVQHQSEGSALTAQDVGVEFYPGAEAKTSNVTNTESFTTNMVQLTSSDDPDKIMKFYEDQLGTVLSKTATDTMRTLIKVDGKIQHSIAIETKDGTSTITISRVDNSGG